MGTSDRRRVVVAGLGNLLLCDDGVGVHAARTLAQTAGGGVTVVDAGTDVWSLAGILQTGDRLLALDAVCAGGQPGSLYRFRGEEAQRAGRGTSVHGLGLMEAIELGGAAMPADVVVLGVEPASTAYGMALSAPVAAALPQMLAEAERIIGGWTHEG